VAEWFAWRNASTVGIKTLFSQFGKGMIEASSI
jgi:hypothetical protein